MKPLKIYNHNTTWIRRFKRIPAVTHVEGELAREVVHAAGMHEAEGVADGLVAQDALACDRTDAAVGQSGGHDTPGLTVHLNGAQLLNQSIKTS